MSHASHRLIVGAYYIHDPRGPRRTPPCALDVSVILSTAGSVLMSVEDVRGGGAIPRGSRLLFIRWDRLTREVSLGDWSVNGRPEPPTCLQLRYPGGARQAMVGSVGSANIARRGVLWLRATYCRKCAAILSYSDCTAATTPLS